MARVAIPLIAVAAAAAANTAGYFLNWFDEIRLYDGFVHLLTGFAAGTIVVAIFAEVRLVLLTLALLGAALAGGVAWEYVELAFNFAGSLSDTLRDLALDAAGALLTLLLRPVFCEPSGG